jgi:tetratricopeptide (TPR) repeat protein
LQYKPKGPILVEVFNNHEMFSGRTVALPDLHTIGACTGRVVAMVSPQGKGVRKPFNWARVLRHELVHVFNLEQTDFLVPHWLTEGLAVEHEGFPRPQVWNQLLLERVPGGEGLYTLDTIDMGFVRPRSPLDWHLAYCQSQLYVGYLREKYGPQAVGGLLDAYRDGLDTAAAIARVCRVDQAAFEKGYRAYLDGVVGALKGRPAEKALSFSELREAHEKDPADLDVAARLAEQYLRRDRAQARKLADAVLAKRKNHPLASVVLARLHLLAGDAERARALLEAAVEKGAPEPKVLRELGKLYYESGQFAKAAEVGELGRRAEPYDREWLVQLARVHAQTGDRARQIGALIDLVPTDADDLENRKRLARLLLEAGRPAEAQRYARQALEISVGDKEAQEVLFKALAAQKKDAEAERLRKLLEDR